MLTKAWVDVDSVVFFVGNNIRVHYFTSRNISRKILKDVPDSILYPVNNTLLVYYPARIVSKYR